jgi:hypothetical protein
MKFPQTRDAYTKLIDVDILSLSVLSGSLTARVSANISRPDGTDNLITQD